MCYYWKTYYTWITSFKPYINPSMYIQVKYVQQQQLLEMEKKSYTPPQDPQWTLQWSLVSGSFVLCLLGNCDCLSKMLWCLINPSVITNKLLYSDGWCLRWYRFDGKQLFQTSHANTQRELQRAYIYTHCCNDTPYYAFDCSIFSSKMWARHRALKD